VTCMKDFTDVEVESKIGKKIRTNHEFSGVPLGTTGTVLRSYEYSDGGFGLEIQWDLKGRMKPLVDGFSKDEYDEFLEEIEV
jgi:hypothetical protein